MVGTTKKTTRSVVKTPAKKSKYRKTTSSPLGPATRYDGTITVPYAFKYNYAPFPPKFRCTLRYVEADARTVGALGTTARAFSCNGIYDPDVSGTGTQPLYFDQLMSIYGTYHVEKSRMTFKATGQVSNAIEKVCFIDSSTAALTTIGSATMRPGARVTVGTPSVGPLEDQVLYWDCKRYHGNDSIDNVSLQGSASANPTDQEYFITSFTDMSGGGCTMYVSIMIEYTVVFSNLLRISDS